MHTNFLYFHLADIFENAKPTAAFLAKQASSNIGLDLVCLFHRVSNAGTSPPFCLVSR